MESGLYYSPNKTAQYKYVVISGATATSTVWTPASGKRIVITGVCLASTLGDLITLKVGTSNSNPDTIYALNVAASTTVTPHLGPIDLSLANSVLYANASAPGTNGVRIIVTGFEE